MHSHICNFLCYYRPLKSKTFRAILTVGKEILEYPEDALSPAASLLESKLLFNTIIPDARWGARFMSCDLKYFFLEIPMSRSKYTRIYSKYFPPDIRALYQIDRPIVEDRYVYIKITKGVYGLKQATIIAYNQLISHMEPHGYYPVPFTTGLWAHKTRRTMFSLCVDDFGVNISTNTMQTIF